MIVFGIIIDYTKNALNKQVLFKWKEKVMAKSKLVEANKRIENAVVEDIKRSKIPLLVDIRKLKINLSINF